MMYPPNAQTTDATQQTLLLGPTYHEDSISQTQAWLFAQDHGGNVAKWKWDTVVRRVGSADPVLLLGTPDVKKTPGASTWVATLVFVGPTLAVQLQGPALSTVDWFFISDDPIGTEGVFAG